MKTKEMQAEWKGMSERMMEGIAKWREEHPKASMREIEEEIDRQLSELRAKMISDTASQSRQADWKKGSRASVCPKCGEPLEKKGKKKRKLQTQGGREVELVREYGVCPKCGEEIFLLDEELGLLPGKLTPLGYERLVKLSGWLPFEKAVDVFGDFTGIEVSRIVSQRNTEAAGQAYVEMQNEEVEYLEKYAPKAEGGADKMQVSADGVMVPLLHGVWAEVRTLVVGEVQEQNGVIHTRNLSYFSRKVSAQEFQRLALVEMQRRGVENARAVAAIMDGADWEQGFTDYHCPQAVRILDFPHAAEHVNAIGESVYGQHTSESTSWLNERLHSLKHDGPDQVLAEIKKLERKRPDSQPIATHLNYLKKRRAQMQYPTFQTQGWPIGSGIVESGNKLVVEARLKGAGMHWAETHVNPMLAIRNILCSQRWKEDWPKIADRLRQQDHLRRSQLHQAHKKNLPPVVVHSPEYVEYVEIPDLPKKLKTNPWRLFKYGKALFQHPASPKL